MMKQFKTHRVFLLLLYVDKKMHF